MASITMGNLEDGLKRRLRIRADENGRSMEEEARDILRTAPYRRSELMRPSPDANAVDWVAGQAAITLYLSTVSEAELRFDVEILEAGVGRDRLLAEVEGMLKEDFAGRVLPFDSAAAQSYAVIAAARRASGRPITHADCQIVAIARGRGASVATREMDDFECSGIDVINPWTDERA